MDSRWHVRLLGTLEARQGKTTLSRFATSRVAALLARLALYPQRAHSREELAGYLWPDADGDAGRLNLRVALSALRHQLEPLGSPAGSVLVTDRLSIRFQPHLCLCDAVQFEAVLREAARTPDLAQKREKLEQALALYEGELLPGFYDEWILEERERLQALCDDAKWQCSLLPLVPHQPELSQTKALRPRAPGKKEPPQPVLPGFPGQLTRFFGRAAEQSRLLAMLTDPEVRLVTLLGPGGSGKTRLAQETARQAAGSFDGLASFDGPICFAALADISSSALIASTIASALRLPLAGDSTPLEQIAAHLASTRSLLVLDNLEHLGEEGAAVVLTLLEAVPYLTCLATSRQKLGLAGEHELRLAPLPVPPPAAPEPACLLPAALLVDYPGVQLFVDRARSVRSDFQLTPQNAGDVADVCRALEGLPLALELAAARIQALSPGQMRQQLAAKMDFLQSRRRDLPPRHRSLRAALEWSIHLLSPEQTHFFAQLSVFRGGWSAEAAAAICELSDPLDFLEQLCERSLIFTEETPLGMRFRMLESLREFGEEQLSPGEKLALGYRHAAYCQGLAAEMEALWIGPKQKASVEVLDAEADNLRAALAFCRRDAENGRPESRSESGETSMRLAGSLQNYWILRGLMREGLDWIQGALAGPGSDEARGKVLTNSGWMRAVLGDPAAAMPVLSEAVALNRRCGSDKWLAQALRSRAVAAIWQGNAAAATADSEESLQISRRIGDEYGAAMTLNNLAGFANEYGGDKQRARTLYEEALALLLKLEVPQRAVVCLYNLGSITHELGDLDRAAALLRESLVLAASQDNGPQRAYGLKALGDVLRDGDDLAGAVAALEEALALARQVGERIAEAGALVSLAQVRRMMGSHAAASALARAALQVYQSMGHPLGRTLSWLSLAETAAAAEKWVDAAACFSAAEACGVYDAEEADFMRYEPLRDALCARLSPAAFAAAWERGRTLTCDDYGLRSP